MMCGVMYATWAIVGMLAVVCYVGICMICVVLFGM